MTVRFGDFDDVVLYMIEYSKIFAQADAPIWDVIIT